MCARLECELQNTRRNRKSLVNETQHHCLRNEIQVGRALQQDKIVTKQGSHYARQN